MRVKNTTIFSVFDHQIVSSVNQQTLQLYQALLDVRESFLVIISYLYVMYY